jgi:D-lactate dehydrogenase (cytochrome)
MHEIHAHCIAGTAYQSVRRVKGFHNIRSSYPTYLTDESKFSSQPFDYLFFPGNENELAAVLREMGNRNTRITIAGARTGLVGGCIPNQGALISLENFNRIQGLYFDPPSNEWRLRAQCAVTLQTIDTQLRAKKFPDFAHSGDETAQKEMDRLREEPDDYFYPPDPTEMSASLGGTVATNASGARTFRFGPTRDWVRGLRIMLVNGEVLDIPRGKYFASPGGQFIIIDSKGVDYRFKVPTYRIPRTKNTSGIFAAPHMDLIDLFIGSEGVFGIITEVTVALFKRSPKISIVQFLDSDDQAIDLVEAIRADASIRMDFLEFYSGSALTLFKSCQRHNPKAICAPAISDAAEAALFYEIDFDPNDRYAQMASLDAATKSVGASLADSWIAYENREIDRLKCFRRILPETINSLIAKRKKVHPELHKLGTDLAVPDENLRKMWAVYRDCLTNAELEWAAFGHIGNSHIHVNILPRDMMDLEKALGLYQTFAQKAIELEGTVSAEHGIGKLKVNFLRSMYSPDEIEQMQLIKKAFDPKLLLNSGNIFGERPHDRQKLGPLEKTAATATYNQHTENSRNHESHCLCQTSA